MSERRREFLAKITKKRRKEDGKSTHKTIVVYNPETYRALAELARKEGTTVSSIINNLYEDILVRTNGAQTALDDYSDGDIYPSIGASTDLWAAALNTASDAEFEALKTALREITAMCQSQQYKRYNRMLNGTEPVLLHSPTE